MHALDHIRVITLAVNLPGPVAAARLHQLGAAVVKVEPPDGDPLARFCPEWYRTLHEGLEVVRLNLKEEPDRLRLHELLEQSDLLVTSIRPAALQRLGMDWPELHARHPRLCHVAIVGDPPPHADRPGHDLTYQARHGLLAPPQLPRALIADSAGAQEAVAAALALLLARERDQGAGYALVSLAEAAAAFAGPLRHGLTTCGGVLGGGFPGYHLYQTRDGWLAVAALEPHFWQRLTAELGLAVPNGERLQAVFLTRTAREWEVWAAERDLPLAALHEPG